MNITFNGKVVEFKSIVIDGIDLDDRPDFCDAYVSEANFTDGISLTDEELEEFTANNGELINDLANESF